MYRLPDETWFNAWVVYFDVKDVWSDAPSDDMCLSWLESDFSGLLPEEWTYVNGIVYDPPYKG